MKSRRLSWQEWNEEIASEIGKMPMAQIARKHRISRPALYDYAQRHGWIEKKNKTKLAKIRRFLKRMILGR